MPEKRIANYKEEGSIQKKYLPGDLLRDKRVKETAEIKAALEIIHCRINGRRDFFIR